MLPAVRIVCWNVGHATREARIPTHVHDAVAALAPDVLVLNEFKDGPSRQSLRAKLADQGLSHWLASEDRSGHNQVFIASSAPLEIGDLRCPEVPDGHAATNFLHVKVPVMDIEVVGFRAPAYNSKALRAAYWRELADLMLKVSDRNIVFAGDFNADPSQRGSDVYPFVGHLVAHGWQVTDPSGPWSFCKGTRIDHATVSAGLKLGASEYVAKVGDVLLSDTVPGQRISDHAALLLQISKAESRREPVMLLQDTPLPRTGGHPNGGEAPSVKFAARGSQRWLQVAVEAAPQKLQAALAEAGAIEPHEIIEWRSPRASQGFEEYRDGAMLRLLGIEDLPRRSLSSFWPPGGPMWDGLGVSDSARILLLEAKAHIAEAASPPTRATDDALARIRSSLLEARQYFSPRSHADWSCTFYQYANRLAFLYLLRILNGLNATLVFLDFCNAPDVHGPATPAEWRGATQMIHTLLGLPSDLRHIGVYHAYIDVSEMIDLTGISVA
jgi:exonuclease III